MPDKLIIDKVFESAQFVGGDELDKFEEIIAVVSLYRPGPMENHYHEIYVKCKNDGREPKYLWGTESIAKDTFGLG